VVGGWGGFAYQSKAPEEEDGFEIHVFNGG
jgi:hypothetical protein